MFSENAVGVPEELRVALRANGFADQGLFCSNPPSGLQELGLVASRPILSRVFPSTTPSLAPASSVFLSPLPLLFPILLELNVKAQGTQGTRR